MKVYFFLLVSVLYSNPFFAQPNLLSTTDSLDKYIVKHMSSFKLPGLAIAIIKDGTIYYQKGYGVKSRGGVSPVDIHTLFPIASVTKTFTGILLSALVSEYGLSINDPIQKYVPGFKLQFQPYQSEISLADVLSHRSGWKTFQGDFLNTESTLSDSQLVNRLNHLKPFYPLRTKFGYSNMGFLLAGIAVKNITGSSISEQLQQRIFNPLQMRYTFTDSVAVKSYLNKASLHSTTQHGITATSAKYEVPRGYGGMYSTVSDLCAWTQMLLDSGRYKGSRIIPYKAIEQSFNSYTIIGKQTAGNRKKYLKTYGLGWEIIQYEGVEIMQHGGAYAGSLSMLAMIPSLKFGVVILTNGDYHPLQETLKWQLIDALLQLPSTDYTQATINRSNERKDNPSGAIKLTNNIDSSLKVPVLLSNTIQGRYICNSYGTAWIKKENNKYILHLEHHPTIKGELVYKGNNMFQCTYSHAMFGQENFLFHINEKGISGFDLRVDPFIEDAVYLFQKN
jgi:CubicO group peptidase (beta-lactamase class C family)